MAASDYGSILQQFTKYLSQHVYLTSQRFCNKGLWLKSTERLCWLCSEKSRKKVELIRWPRRKQERKDEWGRYPLKLKQKNIYFHFNSNSPYKNFLLFCSFNCFFSNHFDLGNELSFATHHSYVFYLPYCFVGNKQIPHSSCWHCP